MTVFKVTANGRRFFVACSNIGLAAALVRLNHPEVVGPESRRRSALPSRLHRAALVQQAKKRSAHRKKRPHRPMVGMMQHQDASCGRPGA